MLTQGTTLSAVPSNGVHLVSQDVESQLVLGNEIAHAPTQVICLENTLAGTIYPQKSIIEIAHLAKRHDIALHLDGARLWNVAAEEIVKRHLNPSCESDRQTV